MEITRITHSDLDAWLEMALALWPDETKEDMRSFLESFLAEPKYNNFIVKAEDGQSAGFINLSIRTDYVEGSSGSPVVYIEGIYVKPEYRRLGMASRLIQAGSDWGKGMGCTEIGSDAYADNIASREFHIRAGFTEAPPIVVFNKKI